MLEMNHDCDRFVTVILVLLMYAIVYVITVWPEIKRSIERNRRAKNRDMYLNENWRKGNYR